MNKLITNVQLLTEWELSIDKGVIPAKNLLGFKQYMKGKPVKFGFTSFQLGESNMGYVLNSEIYTGAERRFWSCVMGKTESTVLRTGLLPRNFELFFSGQCFFFCKNLVGNATNADTHNTFVVVDRPPPETLPFYIS